MQGQNAAGWIHPTGGASAREKVANLIISHCRLFVVERTYSSPPPPLSQIGLRPSWLSPPSAMHGQ